MALLISLFSCGNSTFASQFLENLEEVFEISENRVDC